MNLIRKIVPVKFSELEQKIIDLFKDKLSDLVVFIDESEPSKINYMKLDGTCILQQDNKNDILFVIYKEFWEVLDYKFGMGYDDIQILMKSMIERTFKIKASIPTTYIPYKSGW